MTKFVRNIVLFLLPLLLILIVIMGPFYYLAKGTGELDSIEKSAEFQRDNHNSIIGLPYNEQSVYYKLLNVNYYKVPVISLGISRVMQFHGDFFLRNFTIVEELLVAIMMNTKISWKISIIFWKS